MHSPSKGALWESCCRHHPWSRLTSIIQVLKWKVATKNKERLHYFAFVLLFSRCLLPLLLLTPKINTMYFFFTSHFPSCPDFSSDTVPLLLLDCIQQHLHTKLPLTILCLCTAKRSLEKLNHHQGFDIANLLLFMLYSSLYNFGSGHGVSCGYPFGLIHAQ